MQVDTDVDESFIGAVQEGQPVSFTVFAYPGREFRGEVAQVRLQPKVEAGVVKYNCIIRVDNADLALKPGMTATVAIEVDRADEALLVPHAALRFVPDWPEARLQAIRDGLRSGEALVWQEQDGQLAPVAVSTGIVGERLTEVRTAELSAGARIAVPGSRAGTERKRRFSLSLF
jgi:HlyD family secretion protein